MSKIRFNISVNDGQIADEIQQRITDGIRDSARSTEGSLPDQIEDVAQHRIRGNGAIFKGELSGSFVASWSSSPKGVHIKVENESDHAAPVEYGAEYTEKGPPVVALIPWVRAKMRGFSIPDDDISDLPEPDVIRNEAEAPNYGPDILSQVEDRTLERAFWLQQHIKEEGIDALRYMKAAEAWAEESADKTVAGFITARLQQL